MCLVLQGTGRQPSDTHTKGSNEAQFTTRPVSESLPFYTFMFCLLIGYLRIWCAVRLALACQLSPVPNQRAT
jgi:hypothetical protein